MTPPDYCLTAICLFPAPTIFLWLQYITYWHHYIFHLFWWQQHTVNEIAFAVKTFIFDAIFLSFTTFLLFGHFAPEMVLERTVCVKYFSPSRKYLTQAALSNET